jgi:hypothetical protein
MKVSPARRVDFVELAFLMKVSPARRVDFVELAFGDVTYPIT